MSYRVEFQDELGGWMSDPDGCDVFDTFEEADRALAQLQVFILNVMGYAVEGRIVELQTGAVVHEHAAPRRISSNN